MSFLRKLSEMKPDIRKGTSFFRSWSPPGRCRSADGLQLQRRIDEAPRRADRLGAGRPGRGAPAGDRRDEERAPPHAALLFADFNPVARGAGSAAVHGRVPASNKVKNPSPTSSTPWSTRSRCWTSPRSGKRSGTTCSSSRAETPAARRRNLPAACWAAAGLLCLVLHRGRRFFHMERRPRPGGARQRGGKDAPVVVANSLRLLKAFSDDDYEIGISALAQRLGLAKSTVHGLRRP